MNNERVVAVIQARMTSTRLPGKVLADLAGRPMLEQQVRRVLNARTLDAVWIATTTNASDDPIAALTERLGLGLVRGDEHDVLGRYLRAAEASVADVLVRLTADCPLADAGVIDAVVRTLTNAPDADYASNLEPRTYPRGLDVEAIRTEALVQAASLADREQREHVTLAIRRRAEFSRVSHADDQDNSDLRWTVDEPADLELVRAIYDGMGLEDNPADYARVLEWVRQRPHLSALNAGIETEY